MIKKLIILTMSLFLILLTSCIGLRAEHNTSVPTDITALSPYQDKHDEASEMDSLIRALRFDEKHKRDTAKREILAISNKSQTARNYVIKELLKIASVQNGRAELVSSSGRYYEWSEAVDILGTIKVPEALDVLIECLDCNDGAFGFSPNYFPAAVATIKIGEQSIPKLGQALGKDRRGIRYVAAQALYAIGGDKAKETLEKAMRKETDQDMASAMRDMLNNWDNSNKH